MSFKDDLETQQATERFMKRILPKTRWGRLKSRIRRGLIVAKRWIFRESDAEGDYPLDQAAKSFNHFITTETSKKISEGPGEYRG